MQVRDEEGPGDGRLSGRRRPPAENRLDFGPWRTRANAIQDRHAGSSEPQSQSQSQSQPLGPSLRGQLAGRRRYITTPSPCPPGENRSSSDSLWSSQPCRVRRSTKQRRFIPAACTIGLLSSLTRDPPAHSPRCGPFLESTKPPSPSLAIQQPSPDSLLCSPPTSSLVLHHRSSPTRRSLLIVARSLFFSASPAACQSPCCIAASAVSTTTRRTRPDSPSPPGRYHGRLHEER